MKDASWIYIYIYISIHGTLSAGKEWAAPWYRRGIAYLRYKEYCIYHSTLPIDINLNLCIYICNLNFKKLMIVIVGYADMLSRQVSSCLYGETMGS